MALPDLAASADLSARGVDISDTTLVNTMLTVASSVVRGAAQSPVLQTTSVVTLWATDAGEYLDLPGKPVTAVSAVEVDGAPVTDYKLVHGRLWRRGGYRWACEPVELTVTLTHGYVAMPARLVQIVCDLAILGMGAATAGAHDPNVIAEKIDDYSVTFAQGYESVASAMELPRLTRQSIRKQFGGGAALVASS